MSPIPSDIKLFFLGQRNYIQAPIQLKYALWGIKRDRFIIDISKIYVQRYKQLNETHTSLQIWNTDEVDPQTAVQAELTVTIANRFYDYSLVSAPGEIDRISKPFRQFGYIRTDEDTATAHLENPSDMWEILDEAIQLAKTLHQQKYNRNNLFRFIVGGFEKLQIYTTDSLQAITLVCSIQRHLFHRDTIYNQVNITVEDGIQPFSFILVFIGVKQLRDN